uniref:Uncharacterized protein n=1 Tax=Neogobius melanostomus TaxID=47308 RepID=A0A8C6WE25_9GOBI
MIRATRSLVYYKCDFLFAGQCSTAEFWNSDLDVCVPCASCKQYPKTPSCHTCMPYLPPMAVNDVTNYSSKNFSFSHRQVHRRLYRCMEVGKPIEETAGPLYQA